MTKDNKSNEFDSPTASEYMNFCIPITTSCVKDGIPMAGYGRGNKIFNFACGHCGLVISTDNKRLRDMPLNFVGRK